MPPDKTEKKPGMPRADFIMGIILMLFGVVVVHQSLRLPTFEKDWGGFYAAPGFVPLILGVVIFGLSLILFIRALRAGGHRVIPSQEKLREFVKSPAVHRWCLAMIYSWGFFFILGHVYFFVAAFLVLFAYLATFSKQKLWISAVIAVGASGAIYLIFSKIFLVPLP